MTTLWQCVGTPAMIVSTQNAYWGDNHVSTSLPTHPDGEDSSKRVWTLWVCRAISGSKHSSLFEALQQNRQSRCIWGADQLPEIARYARRVHTLFELSPPSEWVGRLVDTWLSSQYAFWVDTIIAGAPTHCQRAVTKKLCFFPRMSWNPELPESRFKNLLTRATDASIGCRSSSVVMYFSEWSPDL